MTVEFDQLLKELRESLPSNAAITMAKSLEKRLVKLDALIVSLEAIVGRIDDSDDFTKRDWHTLLDDRLSE